MEKEFTFYWLDGKKEILQGANAQSALNNAGYTQGSLSALDFITNGNDNNYIFSKEQHKWIHK